jgi:DNA/RNA endonuclease YhcR with UshA esterase domain
MRSTTAILLAAVSLIVAAPAVAHHAVGGEYDANKPVTVTGTVSKIEWVNPHARVYFDVTEPDGKVTTWSVELAARVVLERMGWNGRSLKIGETVTVRGDQARSGAPMLNARAREQRALQGNREAPPEYPITRADGTPVLNDR